MITREDVLDVATSINVDITEEDVQVILENYEDCQKNDSTSTWNLVIEDMIYSIKNLEYRITDDDPVGFGTQIV